MSEANKDFIHRYMAAIDLGDVRVVSKMKDAERRIDLVAPPRPEPIKPAALKVRPGDEALGMPKSVRLWRRRVRHLWLARG